eukprot:snap_masked-scaffold_74-processed-gene-0.41-mRNA-1 protein AED:1.00 eAED:1.00 QI:0/0/0/0/1/1/2/0/95
MRFNLRIYDFAAETTLSCDRQIKNGLWNFLPTYRHSIAQVFFFTKSLRKFVSRTAVIRKPFAVFANLKEKELNNIEKLNKEIFFLNVKVVTATFR